MNINMIREHWDTLQPRERLVIMVATVAVVALLIDMLFWTPYFNEKNRLEQRMISLQADLSWMQQASVQVKQLGENKPRARASGQSLLSLVDSSAKSHGLARAVKRVQPDGQKTVRVWLEQASFDAMLKWLAVMEDRYGLTVTGLVVDRGDEGSDWINARVVFEGAE